MPPLKVVLLLLLSIACAILIAEIKLDFIPYVTIQDPNETLLRLTTAILILASSWIVLHYVGKLFEKATLPYFKSHARVKSVWTMLFYAIWIFILVTVVVSTIGDLSSLAVYIGLIGAALTFVLQRPLLNILAWILISYRGLYRIGDRINVGGAKGYVLNIGAMTTELREFGEWMIGDTFTGRIAVIPNSMIFEHPVYNYTKDSPFVWDEVVNLVTYESDIDLAKAYMVDSVKEVVGDLMTESYARYKNILEIRDLEQSLLKEPEIRMNLVDSGVNLYVIYYCLAEERRKVKSEITERIWRKFMADPRVEIAYPHMQILGRLDHGS